MEATVAWKGLDERLKPVFIGYDRAELMLAALLQPAARWRPDQVVGIARGGTVPATMAASILGLDVALVGFNRASGAVSGDPPGQRVLLVDDGCSTGRTLHAVRQALARPGRACLTLAIVHDPDGVQHLPDLSHPMQALWRFPWERGEATPAGRQRRATGAGPDRATEAPFTAVDVEGALAGGFQPDGQTVFLAATVRPDLNCILLEGTDPAALARCKAQTATRLGCTHLVEGDAAQALMIAAHAPHLLVTWWSKQDQQGYALSAAAHGTGVA